MNAAGTFSDPGGDAHRSARPAALSVRGLYKSYDGHQNALRGIDLDIAEGEFVTLLGPSGSGKTTLLMVIAGFEAPTRGAVLAKENDISRVVPERRNFGVVFQSYALFPHMSAAANVGYPLAARGVKGEERHRKVDEALALVGLEGLGGRRPSQLSGGQQQRVALARALVYEPALLLLDEPLGALDRVLRERMQIELRTLHQKIGITFLYVTHDQDEALTMSDRVAVMREGRIEQVSTPEELYERPATEFVASFVGVANLLRGRTLGASEGWTGVELDGGARVRAREVRSERLGREATVVVRPERAELRPLDGEDGVTDGLAGEVAKEVFGGNMWRYRIATPAGELQAHRTRRASARPGDAVRVSWDPADAWILPSAPEKDSGKSTYQS